MPEAREAFRLAASDVLGPDEYARFDPATRAISLSRRLFARPGRLGAAYAREVKDGFHPRGTDWRSIVTHEIGHALVMKHALGRPGLTASGVSANLERGVIEKLGLSRQDIARELSEYALNGPQDFVAEAFAEFVDSPAPRRVALAVGQLLLAAFRR